MAKEEKKERKQRVVRSIDERIADAKEKLEKYQRLVKKSWCSRKNKTKNQTTKTKYYYGLPKGEVKSPLFTFI